MSRRQVRCVDCGHSRYPHSLNPHVETHKTTALGACRAFLMPGLDDVPVSRRCGCPRFRYRRARV